MGTGTSHTNTQKVSTAKPPKCAICHKPITEVSSCDWNQGRCPHVPSLLDNILADGYKSRFYNLIKFFQRKK
jgi:hypothetical protein